MVDKIERQLRWLTIACVAVLVSPPLIYLGVWRLFGLTAVWITCGLLIVTLMGLSQVLSWQYRRYGRELTNAFRRGELN